MSEKALDPIDVPMGVVRSVFDNEQFSGKTYKVRAENKAPMSVVTSHIYIDPYNEIQKENRHSPSNWLFKEPTLEKKQAFLHDVKNSIDYFRKSRYNLIKERLAIVKEEQFEEHGRYFEFVDTYVSRQKESESQKVCISCGADNEIKSRKCTNCGGSLIKEKPEVQDLLQNKTKILPNKHFDIVDVHDNHFKIKTGEPDMANQRQL